MHTRVTFTLLALVVCALSQSACVSQKKYNELLDSKTRADRENLRLEEVEREYNEQMEQFSQTLSSLENTEEVVRQYKDDLEQLRTEYNDLNNAHQELNDEYARFRENAAMERAEMEKRVDIAEQRLQDQDLILQSMETLIFANPDKLKRRQQEFRELKAHYAREQARIDSLKAAIHEVFVKLPSSELTVSEINETITLTISQNLLFGTERRSIDSSGLVVLDTLARILDSLNGFHIEVIAHTDDDGAYTYNWNLSAERAVLVANALVDGGVPGERIKATGRGAYEPIAKMSEPNAAVRNRRTEIVISSSKLMKAQEDILNSRY